MSVKGLYLLLLSLIACSVYLAWLLTSGSGVSPVLLCSVLLLVYLMLRRAKLKLTSSMTSSATASSDSSPQPSPRSEHRRRRSRRNSRAHPYASPSSYASTSPSSNEQQQLTPDSSTPPTPTAQGAWSTALNTPLAIQPGTPPLYDPLQSNDTSAFPALSDGRYRLLQTVQKSLFGCVKLAVVQATGKRVCIKISCLYRATLGVTVNGVKVEEDVQREGQLLQYLHSVGAADEKGKDGIVEFVEELRDELYYYLVLGDAGTDLFVHLKDLPVLPSRSQLQLIEVQASITEAAARDIFRQLVEAAQFCHRHHVAINDLSLENVCIDSAGRVRLIDLGLAAIHPSSPHHPNNSASSSSHLPLPAESPPIDTYFPVVPPQESGPLSGKLHYMSSEKFSRQPHCAYAADLYACAIILYTLLTGRPPYSRPLPSDYWWQLVISGRWTTLCRPGGGGQELNEKERSVEPVARELFGWLSDEVTELLDGMIKQEGRRWNWRQVNACRWLQAGSNGRT